MAKERIFDLKQTKAAFQTRGIITGTKSKRFYSSGTSKNGNPWNVVEFGVKINDNKTIFCKLNGNANKDVYYYKKSETKGQKGTTVKVDWKNRYNAPDDGFNLIGGINISIGKDEDGKNINKRFVEYDVVEHIHDKFKDGTSVFIKGEMVFSSYTNKNGDTKRKIDFVPTQISFTSEEIDFSAEDYKEMADFENTLVYSSIEKEMDENGKATGRFVLTGYSIGYNNIENISFIVENQKLATNLRKKLKPGNSILTYGRVNVVNNIEEVEEDDGWGDESSSMERINTPQTREYIVFKAKPDTIDTDTYTEDSIANALKKIKAAKDAENNFVANTDDSSGDDWGDDDDEDAPWD